MNKKNRIYIYAVTLLVIFQCADTFAEPQPLTDTALKEVDGQFMGLGFMQMPSLSTLGDLANVGSFANKFNVLVRSAGMLAVIPAAEAVLKVGNVTYWEGLFVSHKYIDDTAKIVTVDDGVTIMIR